jgi:anti-sigma B factor antagonist
VQGNARPPSLVISQEPVDPHTLVVAVEGRVDVDTTPEIDLCLRDAIESGRTRLVVDLSGATAIDSPMLRVLLRAYRRLGGRNGRFAVVCGDPEACRLLEATGLDEMVDVVATRADALASLGPPLAV